MIKEKKQDCGNKDCDSAPATICQLAQLSQLTVHALHDLSMRLKDIAETLDIVIEEQQAIEARLNRIVDTGFANSR